MLTSLITRETQIKTTVPSPPVLPGGRYQEHRRQVLAEVWRNRNPCALLAGTRLGRAAGGRHGVSSGNRQQGSRVARQPTSRRLSRRTEARISKRRLRPVFTAVLITTAETWEQPGGQIGKLRHIPAVRRPSALTCDGTDASRTGG